MKCLFSLAFVLLCIFSEASAQTTSGRLNWYKGNTHTHTTRSDGDSTPGLVARWYRNHGYDFLVLTDHNVRTEIDELEKQMAADTDRTTTRPFLLIHGEEVSDSFGPKGSSLPIHCSAIDTATTVGKQGGASKVEIVQNIINAVRLAGGLPSINHPNFGWALTADDLTQIKHLHHFEVYNGHPQVNNDGGGDSPGMEQVWDILLSRNKIYYGVAVDDAHHFKRFDRDASKPGMGWVVVRAPELSVKAITEGLATGNFYASTGVTLDDVSTGSKTLSVKITQERNYKYQTDFIGRDGKLLSKDSTLNPSYTLKSGDLYVRAKVMDSSGARAWTQPVFEKD